MSYSTSNPPKLLVSSFDGNGPSVWTYSSTDGAATVDGDGYITNGGDLGMRVGDIVFVTDTDASPLIVTTHIVTSVSSTRPGATDLSDTGSTTGSTDSD